MRHILLDVLVVLWLAVLTFTILRRKPPTVVASPVTPSSPIQPIPSIGRYQIVTIEPNVWRLDTSTGDLCLVLASEKETKRLGEGVVLCAQTPEEIDRLRRVRISAEFNKLPREQRTLERYQQMLREEQ